MEAGKIGNPLLSAALRQSRDGPVSCNFLRAAVDGAIKVFS
jgi:hypothetical protein